MRKLVGIALAVWLLTVGATASAPCVALSFDDGPSGDNTEALLQLLAEKDVRATFFLCGYRIDAYPRLPGRLARAGHELGVHGYSHTCFDALTIEDLRMELERTSALIQETAGIRPMLVRPPCGAWNDSVREAIREQNLSIILWSVDPEDWRCFQAGEVARRVCDRVENGSVILLHDLNPSSVDAAGRIIDRLRAGGYEFLTVSELAERSGTALLPGQAYSQFDICEEDPGSALPGSETMRLRGR